jgi:hypothetical protein
MPGLYRITFRPSGNSIEFTGTRGEKYYYPDGTEVDVHAWPIWCLECGKVAHGEHFETLEALKKEIVDFQDPTSPASQMFHLSREVQLEKLKQRQIWMAKRQSPAKCLDCGSSQIVPLSAKPVPHPAGEGTIECAFIGMCSTDFTNRPYTPEGDRILGPIRPSYWHLPGTPNPALERARRLAHAEFLRLQSGPSGPNPQKEMVDPAPVDPAVINAIHKELGLP